MGRRDEVERLAARWGQRAPARTVLIAPARAGKRSLLNASLVATVAEVTPVRIRADRLLPQTSRGFVATLLAALTARVPSAALANLGRRLPHGPGDETAADALRELEGPLSHLPGRPMLVLEGGQALAGLEPLTLAALDDVAEASSAHIVTLLDNLPPDLQAALPGLLGPSGVRVTRLSPLSRREAGDYLQARLAVARCQATPEALLLMLEYAGGDPASLQLLGARCHDVLLRQGKGRLDDEDVVQGLYLALESLPPEWTKILGEITGRARDAFVALAMLDAPNLADVGRRIDLDAKNVSVLFSRLAERGAPIEKTGPGRYRITHRLLAEWVKKEWTAVG